MPIEMSCTGCSQLLRVSDEHAGKKARCPSCGTIVEVPKAMPEGRSRQEPDDPFSDNFPLESAAKPNPFSDRPQPTANPYVSPAQPTGRAGGFQRAHRGGMVLTFGIVGVLCCMPLGIAAWVMGASDLAEMRAGRMDPSGMDTTRVGMILGIVPVGLAILGIVVNVLLMAVGAAL